MPGGKQTHETTEVFEGLVVGVDPSSRLIQVKKDTGTGIIVEAQWAGGILATMLGIRTNYLPPIGSSVVCVGSAAGSNFVVGNCSALQGGTATDSKTVMQGGDLEAMATKNDDRPRKFRQGMPPLDLLDGEIDMTNVLNTGLSLLTGVARLKAGEAAVLEACLMDSLVRIVSRNYDHETSVGHFKVTCDGNKPSIIFEATRFEHERLGLATPDQQKFSESDNQVGFPGDDEQFRDEIYARFQMFAGWLGDFVSMWVTDPIDQLAESAQTLAKSRIQQHSDGTILIQSIADIVLERVVRMPVPVRKERTESIKGDSSRDAKKPNGDDKLWPVDDDDTIFEVAYKLREHARWLSNVYAMATFRKMTGDYDIVEADVEAQRGGRYFNSPWDPERDGLSDVIYAKYACIRILRWGQIVITDTDNSSVTLAGGNVHISADKNLRLEACGNLELFGARVGIASKNGIYITSGESSIMMAAKKNIKMITEEGGIGIEVTKRTEFPDDEFPILEGGGEGEEGGSGDVDEEAENSEPLLDGLILQSQGKILLTAEHTVAVTSTRHVFIKATRDLVFSSMHTYFTDMRLRVGLFMQNSSALMYCRGGIDFLRHVKASLFGQDIDMGRGFPPHNNHVFKNRDERPDDVTEKLDAAEENVEAFAYEPPGGRYPAPVDVLAVPNKILPISHTQQERESAAGEMEEPPETYQFRVRKTGYTTGESNIGMPFYPKDHESEYKHRSQQGEPLDDPDQSERQTPDETPMNERPMRWYFD